MERKECASEFFTRVWAAFTELNERETYSSTDAARKIYHTFMSSAGDHYPLLCLELRSMFGQPGTEAPITSNVLKKIHELEGQKHTVQVQAGMHSTTTREIDYDRLATLVAEKLSAKQGPSQSTPAGHRAPKGPCYRCGEVGSHNRQDCPNPANPARVRAAKREQDLNC